MGSGSRERRRVLILIFRWGFAGGDAEGACGSSGGDGSGGGGAEEKRSETPPGRPKCVGTNGGAQPGRPKCFGPNGCGKGMRYRGNLGSLVFAWVGSTASSLGDRAKAGDRRNREYGGTGGARVDGRSPALRQLARTWSPPAIRLKTRPLRKEKSRRRCSGRVWKSSRTSKRIGKTLRRLVWSLVKKMMDHIRPAQVLQGEPG